MLRLSVSSRLAVGLFAAAATFAGYQYFWATRTLAQTTTANTATSTITLTAPRTLIDWSTYKVGGGGTLTYDFGVSANDIVINRVTTGSISIDAGGTVQGMYNGHTGGNIWFLAPNGVFINGTVTAAGIVASTNCSIRCPRRMKIGRFFNAKSARGPSLALASVTE